MKKVGHYRRAVWISENPRTLSRVLRQCLRTIPENELHVFEYTPEEQCLVARVNEGNGAIYLHLVVYERGAGAAVIPIVRRARAAEAGEAAPPQGREFIQAQLFCLVRRDHVIWTTHNAVLRDTSVYDLFAKLIESLVDEGAETQFQFQAILDAGVYSRAFDRGIEEIDLGLGDFQSTLEILINDGHLPDDGFFGGLRSLVRRRPTQAEINAAGMVEARLSLKPGRDWSRPHVTSLLSKLASTVVGNPADEFTIVTKDGIRLTRDKMSIHKEFSVEGNRRVLSSPDVEAHQRRIMRELEITGVIDN
ncbi:MULTISPECIES: hypothetical protein [unclassified Mesorhizobium]|uniref:hypothetical protein n=1 Tax=unclassified Mesorhizobium TaxID=325217 RepID=UPI00333683DE